MAYHPREDRTPVALHAQGPPTLARQTPLLGGAPVIDGLLRCVRHLPPRTRANIMHLQPKDDASESLGESRPNWTSKSSSRAAESQSSVPARETGKIPCLIVVQQFQKQLPNNRVVLPREFLRRPRVNHSEEIMAAAQNMSISHAHCRSGTASDCVLGACTTTGISRTPHVPRGSLTQQSLAGDLGMWSPRHTITGGVISLPAWRMCWQPGGWKPPLLNSCVLSKLMRMPA